jgi:hypothetical protein
MRPGAPAPTFGLLALGPAGRPGHRSAGFHWGEARTTPLDAETHLRPLWFNRSTARLSSAGAEADIWFAAHAVPIPPETLFRTLPGCTVHPFAKGQVVDFRSVLAGLGSGPVVRCQMQDPYLLTAHQMASLAAFLQAVPWGRGDAPVPIRLLTHMTDNDPSKRFHLSVDEQRRQIDASLRGVPRLVPDIRYNSPKYDPIHMRYAYFRLTDGERLYVLERGLDIADPRTGLARDASYILEFVTIPDVLRDVLRLPQQERAS